MRISTVLSQQLGVKAILDQQENLTRTQRQIGTGLRILKPSDDPASSVRVLDLDQSIKETQQYLANTETAKSRLSLEEITLSSATNVLQRLRELSVQAVNGSLPAASRVGLEQESRELLGQLLGLANTTNASGEFLFSGFNSLTQSFTGSGITPPGGFAYNGDTNQRNLQIGPTRQIVDGDHGITVFGDPSTGNSVFDDVARFADNISLAVNTPTQNDITALDQALDQILTARANVGARLNALDQQQELNRDFILDVQTTLSDVQDLDFADAISRLNVQTAALQAAQQAYIRVQNLSLFNFL